MNAKERINAVVNLEKPDRVPVGPLLDHFAATYAGISNAELMNDGAKRIAAVLKTMSELGPWDITFIADTANTTLLKIGVPAPLKLPGKDLEKDQVHQFAEYQFLSPEDYEFLVKKGFIRFMRKVAGRLYPEQRGFAGYWEMASTMMELRSHRKLVEKAGAELACGFIIIPFFDYFSMGRSMASMSLDLYDRPDVLKRASRIWTRAYTSLAVYSAKFVGSPRVFIGLSRCSPAMISPRHFQEFVLPDLEYMVNRLIDQGLTPLLHCDTDWTRNFPLLRNFPARKCILELDGHSDIFKAKEVLGDRMCIMGDVPAYLTAFRGRDEVMSYCKRLIEEVGRGGGFILSSGCSIPANAKPENVKALAEAAEEWGYY